MRTITCPHCSTKLRPNEGHQMRPGDRCPVCGNYLLPPVRIANKKKPVIDPVIWRMVIVPILIVIAGFILAHLAR